MNYLLDTNAWIRLFAAPDELSTISRGRLAGERTFGLATISLVEVCQKTATGKLSMHASLSRWMEVALPKGVVTLLAITPAIAREAYSLRPGFHRDPADRLIVATARIHGLTVVTSDSRILDYSGVISMSTR